MSETEHQSPDDRFGDQLRRALAVRNGGDLGQAVAEFRDLCAIYPDNIGARCELAFTLQMHGSTNEAEAICLAVIDEAPLTEGALACLGNIEKRRGDLEAALAWFRRAALASPDNHPIQNEVAWCLIGLERLDEAETVFFNMLADEPRSRDALIGLAQTSRRANRLSAALYFFRQAAREDPADWVVPCEIGFTLLGLGHPADAEAAFRLGLEAGPDQALPYRGLAEVEQLHGRPAAAAEILLRARQRGCLDLDGLVQLAACLADAGDSARAVPLFEEALSRQPGNSGILIALGRSLARSGLKQEAMDLARRFEASGLAATPGHLVRLEIARACNDVNFAREALATAALSTDQNFELWLARVATHVAIADPAGAREALNRPVGSGRAADAGRLIHLQAQLAGLEWRIEEAIDGFNKSLEITPANPDAHFNLSRLHYLRVNIEASTRHLGSFLGQTATGRLQRGQSTRLSQNLVGQLLNELRADTAALDLLRNTVSQTGPGRVDSLLGIVRLFPESTPAAQLLLLALRTSGALEDAETASADGNGGAIPRAIFQYWPDDDPPEAMRLGFKVCRDLHPGWPYNRFNRRSGLAWIQENCAAPVGAACAHALATSQFEALLRLAVLNREGGYFIDSAARCMAPLDTGPGAGARLVVLQEEFSALSGVLLACSPGEAVVCAGPRPGGGGDEPGR